MACAPDDGLERQPLSCEVTLNGLPLRDGTILFEPRSPGVGTAVGGTIRGGHFEVDRMRGPVAGEYLVRIYARSDVQAEPQKRPSPNKPRPLVELIPEIYNLRSQLRATVIPRGPNVLHFDLVDPKSPN
jgi:hypothetical protein